MSFAWNSRLNAAKGGGRSYFCSNGPGVGLFSAVGLPASCPYDIDSPLPNEFVIEIVSGPGTAAFGCGLSGAGVALGNKASLMALPRTSGSNVNSWARMVEVYARIENPNTVRKFIIFGEKGGIGLME